MRKIRYKVLLMMVLLLAFSLTVQSQLTHQKALEVVQRQSRTLISSTLTLGAQHISDTTREIDRIFQSAYLSSTFREYLSIQARNPNELSSPSCIASLQSVFLSLIGSRSTVYSIIYVDALQNVTYCTRDEAGHFRGISALPEQYSKLMAQHNWKSGMKLLTTQRHINTKNQSASTLPYVYTLARRIVNTEAQYRPAGFMFINVELTDMQSLSKSMLSMPESRIFVLDNNTNVIFDSRCELLGLAFPWALPANETFQIDNINYLAINTGINGTSWSILYLVPTAYSEMEATSVSQTIVLVALGAMCLAILLATLLSRAITHPLEQLTHTMVTMNLLSLETRVPVHGRDETAQLSLAFNHLLEKLQDAIYQEYRLKLENREAQLKLLQAQLNPHFMDNVLQSISSIALIRGVNEINVMAKSLGRLLHISIKEKKVTTTLSNEIDHVNNYLAIQSIRFGDRLRVTIDVPEQLMNAIVPRIILQPMVENAITHGLECRQEGGDLLLRCVKAENHLLLEVTDNGQGIQPQQLSELRKRILINEQGENGIGLPNLYARLKLLYGNDATLFIESEWDIGTSVQVLIPWEVRT